MEKSYSKKNTQNLTIDDRETVDVTISTNKPKLNLNTTEVSTIDSNEDLDIEFLPNPNLTKLNYVDKKTPLYSNLYRVKLVKNYYLFQYAIKFLHDEEHLPTRHKKKIFSKVNKQVTEKFGVYIFTGDSMFATTEIKEVVNLLATYKKFQYSIVIQPTKEKIEMQNDANYMNSIYKKKPEVKTILELIIKDILSHNPSLKFVKNLYGKKHAEKTISASENYNGISIMPGFTTKIMFLDDGIYLNVDIKNKILSSYHCLDLINSFLTNKSKVTREEVEMVNKFFKGRTVETVHTNQRFKVEMVNFERKAKDYDVNFESTTIVMTKFYKNIYDIDIDPNSPLLLIKTKGKNEQQIGRYFPPQLCLLVGLTDEMLKDHYLIQNISKFTKQNPEDKVNSLNDIIKLTNEKKGISKKKKNEGEAVKEYTLKSAFQKKEEYGIEVIEVNKGNSSFFGYMMKPPLIKGGNNKIISDIRKPFLILDAKKINFFCIYHKLYEEDKNKLADLIKKSGISYGVSIGKADYQGINSENPSDWIKAIEKINNGSYNLVIVCLDDYLKAQGLYEPIKKHSMESKGYHTQFVLTSSIRSKNAMSIMSNILLQVNSKIGGASYKIDFSEEIKKQNLMLIGVDTSHLTDSSGKSQTLVAFCASLNANFTEYTHKKVVVEEDKRGIVPLPISTFIYEAILEFFKVNKKLPSGIVIYRQGVSKEQKLFLSAEVEQINSLLTGCNDNLQLKKLFIPYYYILVNKKTSLKFFECEAITSDYSINNKSKLSMRKDDTTTYQYDNPDPGLLVYGNMTDPSIFEFYIQPQKVTQGTATPTNFHVAYGNMKSPELIPKLTYDLCYLYSNWRGPVRVPAPLKYAEKLAKTLPKINEKIKNTLTYI